MITYQDAYVDGLKRIEEESSKIKFTAKRTGYRQIEPFVFN